jgi:hypothetical protein
MSLAGNTLHPLQIEDARDAAYRASELQREVEDTIREASRNLAEAERLYRMKLSERIIELHADGVAWTVAGDVARGEEATARLRYNRDVAEGVVDAARQQAYRRAADRRDLHQFITWSERRELRTDAEPGNWSDQPTHGRGTPPGVDSRTGELKAA